MGRTEKCACMQTHRKGFEGHAKAVGLVGDLPKGISMT